MPKSSCLILLILFCFASNTQAQRPPAQFPPRAAEEISPTPSVSPSISSSPSVSVYSHRSAYETQLGWGVLVFGFLTIGLEVLVMLRLKKGWGTQSTRVIGLTLVLISGLFLIVTGYSQEQIAPMIGLLGTITGFLLGKTSPAKEGE